MIYAYLNSLAQSQILVISLYKLLDSLTPQDLYYFLQDAAKCHSPTVWRLAATFFVTKQMRTPKIISHHDGKNQAYSLQDSDT